MYCMFMQNHLLCYPFLNYLIYFLLTKRRWTYIIDASLALTVKSNFLSMSLTFFLWKNQKLPIKEPHCSRDFAFRQQKALFDFD